MESKKEHIFRKLIHQGGVEKPSSEFSSVLMKRINAEAEMSDIKEETMAFLLKSQASLEMPSQGFNQRVMNGLLTTEPLKEPKIISNFTWCTIAVVLVVTLLFALYFGSPGSSPQLNFPSNLGKSLNAIPSVYPLSIFAGGMLLLLDYLLRQKVRSSEL